jgi:hypothetical protein
VCRVTLGRGVGIKAGAGAREKCFLKISPVVRSQQLLLLFSWGLGKTSRGGEVATEEYSPYTCYLPIARKSEEATREGLASGSLYPATSELRTRWRWSAQVAAQQVRLRAICSVAAASGSRAAARRLLVL